MCQSTSKSSCKTNNKRLINSFIYKSHKCYVHCKRFTHLRWDKGLQKQRAFSRGDKRKYKIEREIANDIMKNWVHHCLAFTFPSSKKFLRNCISQKQQIVYSKQTNEFIKREGKTFKRQTHEIKKIKWQDQP